MIIAHEMNVKFNDLVVLGIKKYIEEKENERTCSKVQETESGD